jgi:endo-1,4-beta-xylanase
MPEAALCRSGLSGATSQKLPLIGAALNDRVLAEGEHDYERVLASEFNYATPENALKWKGVQPEKERWDFARADLVMRAAEDAGMAVKGHTLVWHEALPEYVSALDAAELEKELETHIHTLVDHYKGRIVAWDVLNEAIASDGKGLRSSVFLERLGSSYIAKLYRWAHEADPQAVLIYNDYEIEQINDKSDRVYELASSLLDAGVPLHGVGLQMHLCAQHMPSIQSIADNIGRFGELGLRVNVSEMDVRIRLLPGTLEERLARQERAYYEVVKTCVESSACDAVTFWGFTDAHSWVDRFFGEDDPLLFDAGYRPKPAYFGVLRALAEAL